MLRIVLVAALATSALGLTACNETANEADDVTTAMANDADAIADDAGEMGEDAMEVTEATAEEVEEAAEAAAADAERMMASE